MINVPETFDPNAFEKGEQFPEGMVPVRFPSIGGTFNVSDYADAFASMKTSGSFIELSKIAGVADAPEMQSYSRLSQMPNAMTQGLVQWPGLPSAMLKKISADHYIVHTIIQQRIADVGRYSNLSSHPWKPGWAIELREGGAHPTKSDLKDIQDAIRFTLNCNAQFGWDARERDEAQLTSWKSFLSASVRDTLRYDLVSWWTDMDLEGRVRAFKCLPASNIMLCTRDGYKGKPKTYACGVDDAGSVIQEFTRKELTTFVRNTRSDAEVWGYGYPEIEMGIRLIQGFSNAFDMNADVFTRDAIPPGLLKLKGMWTQRQVEVLSRMWMNLKRGATKKWALPALPVPKDGDVELLDFSSMKENSAYYGEYINMVAGLFCAIYAFPVTRLGYRVSGNGKDSEPNSEQSAATLVDQDDPGLEPLLSTIESNYNQYILWSRWPHLQLVFRGKNPREDSREYEARTNASTFNEVRALSDEKPLEDTVDAEHKELATLMGMAPRDPNLAGVWQNLAGAFIKAKFGEKAESGDGAGPESEMSSKTDPAESEKHGHASGLRRDSAAETKPKKVS